MTTQPAGSPASWTPYIVQPNISRLRSVIPIVAGSVMDAWRARLRAASRRHLHWGISLDRSATLLLVVAVESVRVVVLNALIERRRPGVFQPSIWRRRIRVVRIHATGTPHRTLGLENTKLVHTGTRDPEDANHQANLSIEVSIFYFETQSKAGLRLEYHRVPYIAHCFSA